MTLFGVHTAVACTFCCELYAFEMGKKNVIVLQSKCFFLLTWPCGKGNDVTIIAKVMFAACQVGTHFCPKCDIFFACVWPYEGFFLDMRPGFGH